jgi:hypothetical protein
MAIRVYRHTDASAPTLTGQVGSMSDLLLACLVNGYGSKAAAGWTNPINGATGQRVFRPGSGVQHYFAHDDSGPGLGGFKEARFCGFETMSAWATGTGQFPTTAQSSFGLVDLKSSTADATARPWVVIADGRTCYAFAAYPNSISQYASGVTCTYSGIAFGEVYSLMTVPDNYRSFVIGRNLENSTTAANDWLPLMAVAASNTTTGHYMARTYTGVGLAVAASKWGDYSRGGANPVLGSSGLTFPDQVTGAIHLAPLHFSDNSSLRGRMRGFFQLCHQGNAFADGDTIVGSGAYAGRTFLVVKNVQSANGSGGSTSAGVCVFDITGPWETN